MSVDVIAPARPKIEAAMRELESLSCLKFREMKPGDRNWIRIYRGIGWVVCIKSHFPLIKWKHSRPQNWSQKLCNTEKIRYQWKPYTNIFLFRNSFQISIVHLYAKAKKASHEKNALELSLRSTASSTEDMRAIYIGCIQFFRLKSTMSKQRVLTFKFL